MEEGEVVDMFEVDQEIELKNISDRQKKLIETVFNCELENIDFRFVECTKNNYAVVIAETDKQTAVLECPMEYIDTPSHIKQEVNELIDHVINTYIMDRALDNKDKELFDLIVNRQSEKEKEDQPPKKKAGRKRDIQIAYLIQHYEYDDVDIDDDNWWDDDDWCDIDDDWDDID